jgi:membrane protease YdiL (CAAX protease family)
MGLLVLLLVAIDGVPLVVLLVALAILWRRRRRDITLAVPAVLAGLALLIAVWVAEWFLDGLASIRQVDPASKATLLSLGISEAMNFTALALLVSVPVLLVSWLVDRRLRRGAERPTAPPHP